MWDEIKFERDKVIRRELIKELISVQVHLTNLTKTTKVGALFLKGAQKNFKVFLQKNVDVFAWSYEDMSGTNLHIITHRLNIDPKYHPIKKKRNVFNSKHYEAIKV